MINKSTCFSCYWNLNYYIFIYVVISRNVTFQNMHAYYIQLYD